MKASYPDLTGAETLAKQLSAKYQWRKWQVDTYFHVAHGRLKLREAEGEATELISYFRNNQTGSRESSYQRLVLPASEPLKKMLADTLGILIEVKKLRTLYLYRNVRIHLDEVDSLGNFLELEGVLGSPPEIAATTKLLQSLRRHFGIEEEMLVRFSYSDLLQQQQKSG